MHTWEGIKSQSWAATLDLFCLAYKSTFVEVTTNMKVEGEGKYYQWDTDIQSSVFSACGCWDKDLLAEMVVTMWRLTPSGGSFVNFTLQCASEFAEVLQWSTPFWLLFSSLLISSIYCILICLLSFPPPLLPDLTGDPCPPRCPSRQAWQTVSSQRSTGPPMGKRMARMATPPTALPTGRMDTMVGQLHILGQQVGTWTWCASDLVHAYACSTDLMTLIALPNHR